jgi:hypothetical protein
LLSFVESAPRAYRLKVGNADLFRNSTEPGTSPDGGRTRARTWDPMITGHWLDPGTGRTRIEPAIVNAITVQTKIRENVPQT